MRLPKPSEVSAIDSSMNSALVRASHHARAYLATLDRGAVASTVSRQELLSRLDVPYTREGVAADVVVDELVAAVDGGLIGSAGGRFFAWVIGGALPSAVATEWLMSAWDQNAAIYATSPVSSVVEEVAGKWLLDVLRLPAEASFGFTTGCQTAHLTALAAARDHLLRERAWDVAERGLAGSDPIRVFATALHHVSLDRALRYLGIGTRQLQVLPVAADGRLESATLEAALAHGNGPTIVTLVTEDAARDEIDWNPEWSKRARGFPVYAALRELGRDGLTSLIDRSVDHCARLVARIGELPGAEIVWRPTINQGLVRFLAQHSNATPEDHDAWTATRSSPASTGVARLCS
jgi:aromatic-L-amino-acid decarboxylase